jgi:hypothetical protein
MPQKVEAKLELSLKIENNPIELFKAIKEHTQSYQEHRYDMSTILDSLRNLLSTKQKEGVSLHNYTKQFKTSWDIFEAPIGGQFIIHKVARKIPESKTSRPKMMKKSLEKTSESFLAHHYLENADMSKYQTLLSGLNAQQSLGNNEHPKAVLVANNVLSNPWLDIFTRKKRNDVDFEQKRQMPLQNLIKISKCPLHRWKEMSLLWKSRA